VKTSIRFLGYAGLFGILIGIVYWQITQEPAGTTLLVLMGVATLIMGYVVWRRTTGKRFPEDAETITYAQDAGDELGHFSAGSLWPFVMAAGVVIGVEGLIYGIWLLVAGLLLFTWATVGLMQESHG
jgi:Cytochrome c oxidase subunit IV